MVVLDLLIYLHLYSENKQMSNGFGTTLMTLFYLLGELTLLEIITVMIVIQTFGIICSI